jgi:anti-sigma-K factor RskA
MNCEELREHYDLYALDIAEEPERGEIRVHLNRGCEVCMAGVKRALETTTSLAATAPDVEPSRKLRRRILASVGAERRAPGWFAVWAMSAVTVAALVIVLLVVRDANQDRQKYADEAARSQAALAILYGPKTVEASFGGAQPRPPQGRVFVNPSQGVLLIASNLPPTSADKIYEMWLIPKGAKPIAAGLFQSKSDGEALHIRPGTVDIASTAAIAVTVENQAGAEQPTTTPLIVAALPVTP